MCGLCLWDSCVVLSISVCVCPLFWLVEEIMHVETRCNRVRDGLAEATESDGKFS